MQPFRFGAVSLTGGSHLRPPFGGQLRHSSQQHQQERGYRTVVVAAAATGTASILLHRHAQGNVVEQLLAPKEAVVPTDKQATLCQLPRELAEIICGAIGEIVQVACLFPLDTIKVRCQAGGVSARTVVKQLLASGSLGSVLRQLYAGVFGASLASVAVGSVYFFTFCAAKRTAAKLVVDCHHDSVMAAVHYDDAAPAAPVVAAAASSTTSSSKGGSSNSDDSGEGGLHINILAACAAATVGALVEAPVELFKHRAQAGQIAGNMFGHIMQALRKGGPVALYGSFFLPFCFKNLPYDIAELVTYSGLQDYRKEQLAAVSSPSKDGTVAAVPTSSQPLLAEAGAAAALAGHKQVQQQQQQLGVMALGSITAARQQPSSANSSHSSRPQQQPLVANVPDHFWDCAVGAAAGVTAVMISMPADCIKTVMETGSGVAAPKDSGALGSAAAFMGTGKQLLKQHGPKGLFIGLAPRLVESVPSTVLYWLAVEGCRKMLEPYVAK